MILHTEPFVFSLLKTSNKIELHESVFQLLQKIKLSSQLLSKDSNKVSAIDRYADRLCRIVNTGQCWSSFIKQAFELETDMVFLKNFHFTDPVSCIACFLLLRFKSCLTTKAHTVNRHLGTVKN